MHTSPSAEDRCLTVSPTPAPPMPTRALGLTPFDQAAIIGFVSGDQATIQGLVEDTRQLAEALAGPAGDGARVRLLARTAAACRSQLRVLEGLLAQRVAARDFEAVAALSRALDGVAKRMVMAVRQLGVESSLRQRPSVVIGHADRVDFAGGGQ
ncbi:MAG: hypothetical protein HY901_07940 [Deltaproteobacteria bacterium]|nr:hypothetical protein [Deltaproteobacteria bacterium]